MLKKNTLENKSKFLSLILRHKPEKYNITLDKEGWATVESLISNNLFTNEELLEIVKTDSKQRYSFNKDFSKIRANQGHSISSIEINYKSIKPPQFLYHGTYHSVTEVINKNGLLPMNRLYVHLSDNIKTAVEVGKRRGKPIVIKINAEKMYNDKQEFYLSENNVYLTKKVDSKYFIETITNFKNI